MERLDLNELTGPREAWVTYGGVEFLLRYSSPRIADRFRQRLVADGITAKDGNVNRGREDAFYLSYAREYVLDWRGNIDAADGQDASYTPEKMATVLAGIRGVFLFITECIAEDDRFFGRNGTRPI